MINQFSLYGTGKYLNLKSVIKQQEIYSKFIFKRNLNRGLPKLTIIPVVSYKDAKINKSLIFKENKDKAFVYRWINLINNKEYLGSTSNAKKRLNNYYNLKTLSEVSMPIYKSILKYGHENFTFEIIEYCLPDMTLKREQYYLDNFDFEYNVLANANSMAGYKHTAETIVKMKGRQNLKGFKHSTETIKILSEINKSKVHSEKAKEEMKNAWAQRKLKSSSLNLDLLNETNQLKTLNNKKKELSFTRRKIVVITNIETNISTEYNSISEAATVLNLTRVTLRKYIKKKEVFNILKKNSSLPHSLCGTGQDGTDLINEKYLITLKNKT